MSVKNIQKYRQTIFSGFTSAKLAGYIVMFLTLSACTDVVQIKLDQGSTKYVVDAFINDLRIPQVVTVKYNAEYFSNASPEPVDFAQVTLQDLTGGVTYNFKYETDGRYVYTLSPADSIARIGHQYKLIVNIKGNDYTSLSIMKRKASIDSISQIPGRDEGFGRRDTVFRCRVYAKDKTDREPDYYWIKTYRNDTLLMRSSDINVCIDGTGGPVDLPGIDSTEFSPPATFLGFRQFRPKNKCMVEIHSIEKATYFFFVQIANQQNNTGLFATTPENIKTNIITPSDATIKGQGWFSMSAVASKSIILHR
jgi:hypothetical protein